MHRPIPPSSDHWVAEYTGLLRRQACAAAEEHVAEARALGGRLRAGGATPSRVVAGAAAALTALTRGRRVRLRDAIAADGVLRPALLAAFDALAPGSAGADGARDPASRWAELEERSRRFDELLAHARDPIFCVRLDTRELVYVTPAAAARYGLDLDELRREGIAGMLARIHPEDRARVEATYTRGPDGRNPTAETGEVEYRLRVADGSYRWFNSHRVWVRDAAGRPRYMIGQVRDVHAQRQATEHLREALAYVEGLLKALPDTLFRVRRDGLLLDFKPAPDFVPYAAPAEFLGRNILEVLPAPVSERILAVIRDAVDHGRTETIEYELAYPDQDRVFEARAARCAPDEALVIVRDLTDRRRAEATVRASEERLRMVLDATADGVWDYHVPTDTLHFSPSWLRLLGLEPADVEPRLRSWVDRLHPDDRAAALSALQAHLRGDTPAYRAEFRMRTAADEWKWILARGRVVERDACNEAVRVVGTHTDIGAQKQTEEALRASEEQYRLLVEHQTDMVCRTDPEGRLLFVSPSYCDTFGVSEAELLGRPFIPLVHEEDRAAVEAGWNRTFAPPYASEVVERALTRHGWRWQAWHNKAVLAADGQVTAVVGVGRDIHAQKLAELELERYRQELERRVAERTRELADLNRRLEAELAERREAQAALRRARDELEARVAARTAELLASEERWRSLVTTAPDFIMLLDLDGTIRYLNRASRGLEVEDNLGTHLTLHAFPEFAPRIDACLEEVARTGRFVEFEMAGLRPDASTAWYACRVGPFRQDGRIVALTCIATDITDRKRAEQELERHREQLEERVRERTAQLVAVNAQLQEELARRARIEAELRNSEQMFRTLAETVPAAIVIAQGERIRFANGMTAQVVGRPIEEVLRTPPWEFVHPEMRAVVRARALDPDPAPSGPARYELRVLRPDGTDRWLDFSVARIELEGQPAALAVALDATARKAAAAKERQHLDQLAHVGRVSVVGELAAGVAHDLAQPVSAILYYAKGALARPDTRAATSEHVRTVLERIARQSERAAEIIRRLKDFVRRAEPRRTPQQLAGLVAEAVHLAEPLSRAKRAPIAVSAADELPLVTVDPIQIEQVLINLLQNAIEAVEGLPPEHRRITVRVHAPTPTEVCVSVTDHGPGVSPAVRPNLFTSFCTTKPDGLGVGLSMARSIIEAHDGRLWLEDTPAGPTTFTFALPVEPAPTAVEER